jgi:Protein of unknown function (DUF3305)
MSAAPPLEIISVGVVVERTKGTSAWADYLWRVSAVLAGVPDTPLWSKLSDDGERTTFYAGAVEIELHRTETTNYRDNLATGEPLLWVVLRKTDSEPPYNVFAVLADPAEGEAMTEAGSDLVDTVAMPEPVQEALGAFIQAHHVEREFVKRKRDRANKEALAKREGER